MGVDPLPDDHEVRDFLFRILEDELLYNFILRYRRLKQKLIWISFCPNCCWDVNHPTWLLYLIHKLTGENPWLWIKSFVFANKLHLVWSKVNLLEPPWICKVCQTRRPLTLQWILPSNSWCPIASLVYVAWCPWSGLEMFCKQRGVYPHRGLVLCYCCDLLTGLFLLIWYHV